MITNTKRLAVILLSIALLLLIPFAAMQYSSEVNWTLSDFVMMGGLLLGVALAFELIARRSENIVYKIAFGIGLIGAFLLFWVNAAVGIIGSAGQSANLMYGIVLMVGLVGSLLVRFKALGMSHVSFACALTQILVTMVALFIWPSPQISLTSGLIEVFLLNAFFVTLFVISGLLFRRAHSQ